MPYRPVGQLRKHRYVTLSEASDLLGGLLSAGQIRDLVRAGRVPGAIRAGRRYWVQKAHVGELITDMSGSGAATQPPATLIPAASARRRNVFDGRAV